MCSYHRTTPNATGHVHFCNRTYAKMQLSRVNKIKNGKTLISTGHMYFNNRTYANISKFVKNTNALDIQLFSTGHMHFCNRTYANFTSKFAYVLLQKYICPVATPPLETVLLQICIWTVSILQLSGPRLSGPSPIVMKLFHLCVYLLSICGCP